MITNTSYRYNSPKLVIKSENEPDYDLDFLVLEKEITGYGYE